MALPESPQEEVAAQHVWKEAWREPTQTEQNLGEVGVRSYMTGDQERELQQQQEEATPGLLEAAKMSVKQDWVSSYVFDDMGEFEPDPDYEMTEEDVKGYMEGIPERYWDTLEQAKSRRHAEALAAAAQKDWEVEQRFALMGWKGGLVRMGVSLGDPGAWGIGTVIGAATGGAGTAAVAAGKISKLRHIGKTAAVGAGANLAVEAPIAAEKPIYDHINLLYAGTIGAAVGASVGSLARKPAAADEVARLKEAARRQAGDLEGEAVNDSIGAARTNRVEEYSTDERLDSFTNDETSGGVDSPYTAFGKGRIDVMGRGKSSVNPVARAGYNVIGEDAVGNADKALPTAIGATEVQMRLQGQNDIAWRRAAEPNYKTWVKRQNDGKYSWWQAYSRRKEFNEQVTHYIRNTDPHRQFDPEVAAAGEHQRKFFDDMREQLNQPGADRAEFRRPVSKDGQLDSNPNYVPREHDMRKFADLEHDIGTDGLRRLVAGAFRKNNPDIEDADALRAATAYIDTLRKLRYGVDTDMARILKISDAEELKRTLKDSTTMDDVEVEDLIDALTVRKQDGLPQNLKQRMDLDENFSARMNTKTGPRTVHFHEMLNNDIESLFQKYNRRMTGAVAMAQFRIPGLVDGVTTRGEWDTYLNKVRSKANEVGQDEASLRKDIDGLNYMYDSVMGIPREGTDSAYAQTLKQFRDANFARLMGQVGWAQIPEFGIVASSLGFKAMIQTMPTFRALWRDAQTGKLGTELADELELLTGRGGDWLRGTVLHRWDDVTGAQDTFLGQSPKMQKLEGINHVAKRAVFAGSGMSSVNTLLQRFTLSGIANKFDLMARGQSKINAQRMRSLGLGAHQQEAIFRAIRDHAQHDARGRLSSLGIDQWPKDVANDFQNAIFRYSRRVVQENDPGQFAMWMSRPTAQTLLQFKTFILGAYTKNLLHNLHMRDFETWVSFTSQSFLAGLAYTAWTYQKSVGREDQDEYLKEHLSVANVARAAFARAGYSSLIPTAVDTVSLTVGAPALFNYRTTGQSMDLILGNPTGDLLKTINSLMEAIGGSVAGSHQFSQDDLRNLFRVAYFQNLMGITQLQNLMLKNSGLPAHSPD